MMNNCWNIIVEFETLSAKNMQPFKTLGSKQYQMAHKMIGETKNRSNPKNWLVNILRIAVFNPSCLDTLHLILDKIAYVAHAELQNIISDTISHYIANPLERPYILMNLEVAFQYVKATPLHVLLPCLGNVIHTAILFMIADQPLNQADKVSLLRPTIEYAERSRKSAVIQELIWAFGNSNIQPKKLFALLSEMDINEDRLRNKYAILTLKSEPKNHVLCEIQNTMHSSAKTENNEIEIFSQEYVRNIPPELIFTIKDDGHDYNFDLLHLYKYIVKPIIYRQQQPGARTADKYQSIIDSIGLMEVINPLTNLPFTQTNTIIQNCYRAVAKVIYTK